MTERTAADIINDAVAERLSARSRDEWAAADDRIAALCNGIPLARELGALKLSTSGGYTVRQMLGPSGVLMIVGALLTHHRTEPATSGYATLLHELHGTPRRHDAEAAWADVWGRFKP